jgi:hypothetical protein
VLTEQQKDEVERHLRYPSSGASAGGLGPPFFAELGTGAGLLGFPTDPANLGLRFRLNNLPIDIEVKIVGADHPNFDSYLAFGGVDVAIDLPGSPNPGDPVILQIDKEAITYTLGSSDTDMTIAGALATALTEDPVVGPYFVGIPVTPGTLQVRARQWGNQYNSTSVAAFSGQSVNLSVYQPGTTTATFRMYGGNSPPGPFFVDPNATPSFPIYGYLPWCRYWEVQVGLAAQGMDTIKADVFTQERNEYIKRRRAYFDACKDMAQALGIHYAAGGSFDGGGARRRIT